MLESGLLRAVYKLSGGGPVGVLGLLLLLLILRGLLLRTGLKQGALSAMTLTVMLLWSSLMGSTVRETATHFIEGLKFNKKNSVAVV